MARGNGTAKSKPRNHAKALKRIQRDSGWNLKSPSDPEGADPSDAAMPELQRLSSLRLVAKAGARFRRACIDGELSALDQEFQTTIEDMLTALRWRVDERLQASILEIDQNGEFKMKPGRYTDPGLRQSQPEMSLEFDKSANRYKEPARKSGVAPYCYWSNTSPEGAKGIAIADDIQSSSAIRFFVRTYDEKKPVNTVWYVATDVPDVFKGSTDLYRSLLVAPILDTQQGTCIGVLCVTHPDRRVFRLQDCAWAENCAIEFGEVYAARRLHASHFPMSAGQPAANTVRPSEPRVGACAVGQCKGHRIFVGHGGSQLWRQVRDHLENEHGLEVECWESESRSGRIALDVVQNAVQRCCFAVMVVTAEDPQADGQLRTRQNVLHEIGMFHTSVGPKRVALLEQDCVESLSNLDGLQRIKFSGQDIAAALHGLDKVLRREKLIARPG